MSYTSEIWATVKLSSKIPYALAVVLSQAALGSISSTVTLSQNSTLNLDTGTTGTSGGDLLFSFGFEFQGSATRLNFGPVGATYYNTVSRTLLLQAAAGFQNGSLSVAVNTVVGVHTSGGNWAKLLITASSDHSITFQFTTFTTNGPNAPSITQIQNNYSYALEGLPNYGIAPGSMFIIKGAKLNNQPPSNLQSSAPPGLPTMLNGTSISVSVNGTTVMPGIYYTSPTQLAAVLPSNVPAGTGTITVNNNGQSSAPEQLQVVQSALGFGTYDGTGNGLALAQDAGYNPFSTTNSATPGQTIILWGSGVGADTTNDDKTYPQKQNDLGGVPMQINIGGLDAAILYRGRSQFPGVDQVVVTIPNDVPVGCAVSIVAVSGNIVSNSVTLPIAQGGGTCAEPDVFPSAGVIQDLRSKPFVSYGQFLIGAANFPPGRSTNASASFSRAPGSVFANFNRVASNGSCRTFQGVQGSPPAQTFVAHPDLGTLSVLGPAGFPATMHTLNPESGTYDVIYPVPSSGGDFEFSGTGGQDVGAFKATVNFPPPVVPANSSAPTDLDQGVTVTWTGGAPDTYVEIYGSSSTAGGTVNVQFFCFEKAGAGRFLIPSWVLLALPPFNEKLFFLLLSNVTNPQPFSVPGLDFAFGIAAAAFQIEVSSQ